MATKSLLIRDFGGIEALTNLGAATANGSPVIKSTFDAGVAATAITAKLLTGYTGAETGTVAATDTILAAFSKLSNSVAAVTNGVLVIGGYNADTNSPDLDSTPISVVQGGSYYVTTAGTFFTTPVEIGDTLIALQADPTLESHWLVLQANLTPASIKSQYESNADTNAFTDTEKTKLSNAVVTTDKISVLAETSSAELAGVISDETGSGALVFATSPTLVTPNLGTPSTLVATNASGTASGLTAGLATTLTDGDKGDITVSSGSLTVENAAVTGQAITGFSAGAGTVAATDTILQAFNKIVGNINALPTGALKYVETVGDGAETTFVLTHNLGTADIIVFARELSTGDQVEVAVLSATTTQVTIDTSGAPDEDDLRVVILG